MSFYTDVIRKSPAFLSNSRINDLALLEPVTRAAVQRLIFSAQENGVALIAFETYRSQQRQELLFSQKATQLKTVGVHHFGLACDFVKDVGGEPNWKGDFGFLKPLAEVNGLIWGGDWGNGHVVHSFRDPDHVQRVDVADQSKLFNLSWYPEEGYQPSIA
jgi:hypothetical protein